MSDTGEVTYDQLLKVLPKHRKSMLTQQMVDDMNALMTNPVLRETYRDNLLSYTNVLTEGKFSLEGYVEAVRFVSFRLMGDSTVNAYSRTFPVRYQRMVDDGRDNKFLCTLASSFNKNMLVQKIFEQTMTPSHILNAGMYQDALNVQHDLMHNAKSEHVRMNAADSVMTQLRPPENKKLEVDINIREDQSIQELRATTMGLVAKQKQMIMDGTVTVKQVAHSKLVHLDEDGEIRKAENIEDGEIVE